MKAKTHDLKKNRELERLINEQSSDMTQIIYPEVITPLRPETLECLTTHQKACIILRVIGSMTYAEIARALKTYESSVRHAVKRSYEKIRENLRDIESAGST